MIPFLIFLWLLFGIAGCILAAYLVYVDYFKSNNFKFKHFLKWYTYKDIPQISLTVICGIFSFIYHITIFIKYNKDNKIETKFTRRKKIIKNIK